MIIVNQTLVNILGFKHPENIIGKTIDYGEKDKRTVIGVTGDFYQRSLHESIQPVAISPPLFENSNFGIHIALKRETAAGNEWKDAISQIGNIWNTTYPSQDFQYFFIDESINRFYDGERRIGKLLGLATCLSVIISCLGLLGLAVYTTTQRRKEIGVRKVLGASVLQIVGLLSSELIRLIGLAFIIVTPIAWLTMNNWMQSFAYRTSISWWLFAASGIVMLLTALFTLSFQTIKAASANPANSLRSE